MDTILKLVLEIIGRSVVADWNRRDPANAIKPGDKLVRQLKGSSFSVEFLLFKRLSAMGFMQTAYVRNFTTGRRSEKATTNVFAVHNFIH